MRVLVFEDNLIWSGRVLPALRSLGFQPVLYEEMPTELPPADAAIVNLSSSRLPAVELVPQLRAAGIKVLAHAGHKERPLIEVGNELGCDLVVSNSTLTFKLGESLARLFPTPLIAGDES